MSTNCKINCWLCSAHALLSWSIPLHYILCKKTSNLHNCQRSPRCFSLAFSPCYFLCHKMAMANVRFPFACSLVLSVTLIIPTEICSAVDYIGDADHWIRQQKVPFAQSTVYYWARQVIDQQNYTYISSWISKRFNCTSGEFVCLPVRWDLQIENREKEDTIFLSLSCSVPKREILCASREVLLDFYGLFCSQPKAPQKDIPTKRNTASSLRILCGLTNAAFFSLWETAKVVTCFQFVGEGGRYISSKQK